LWRQKHRNQLRLHVNGQNEKKREPEVMSRSGGYSRGEFLIFVEPFVELVHLLANNHPVFVP
jgi:hypothetical protein